MYPADGDVAAWLRRRRPRPKQLPDLAGSFGLVHHPAIGSAPILFLAKPPKADVFVWLSVAGMNPKHYYLVAAAFLVSAGLSIAEQRIERSQLPSQIQEALNESIEGGQIKEITRRTVFEVQVEKQNAPTEYVTIAEDGTVIQRSRTSQSAENARQTSSASASRTSTAMASTQTAASASSAQPSEETDRSEARRAEQSPPRKTSGAADRDQTPTAVGVTIVETIELRPVDTESMIPLQQLPAAVREGIEREAPGRAIADIDRETSNGRMVYEVEFRDSGINPRLHFTENGMLVPSAASTADAVANFFAGTQVSDLPAAVQETVRREVSTGRVMDVDIERRTGRTVYEIEVESSPGRQYEFHVAENGTVIRDDRIPAE